MDRPRRHFLQYLLAAAVAAQSGCRPTPDATSRGKASGDKLRVAVIGLGGWGRTHVRAWKARGDVEIAYLCDADPGVGQRLAGVEFGKYRRPPKLVTDMRRIFDDRDVDAVSIATPHHWHALAAVWAMQAGKDVFVEKPVSHNLREGRVMVAAARKYNRICQAGTQRRSHGVVNAMARYIQERRLGTVSLAHCLTFKRRPSIGPGGPHTAPANVELDLWLGPAPRKPVTRRRFHYDWHWFWDYGNGAIGNNGIHRVDVARWAMGLDNVGTRVISLGGRLGRPDAGETPNTQLTVHAFDNATIVHQVRGLPTGPYKQYGDGVVFFGTEGVIAYSGKQAVRFDDDGAIQQVFGGTDENHFGNFVEAIRSRNREQLNADIQEGHRSSALCHLANISYRLGKPASARDIARALEGVPSQDDVRETFRLFEQHLAENRIDLDRTPLTLGPWLELDRATDAPIEPEAEPFLWREYRAPFVLPDEKGV
ncbi:MAG TPA: Gfo/Idh/MocA family oxidoreductase [Steroidobacteraceae bacterium]|nr:Gfo/Idh/MocA family oxidoreductase [Steroidobacteraceae bacterium]